MVRRMMNSLFVPFILGVKAINEGEDSWALIQTKLSADLEQPSTVGSTCTFQWCGPPWEAQVVTVFVKAYASPVPCMDCDEAGFQLYMRGHRYSFKFQPWRRTVGMLLGNGVVRTYRVMWVPAADVKHNLTVVMRNNGVHSFIFTDGQDPQYVFRADFFDDEFFASTAQNGREYKQFHVHELGVVPAPYRNSGELKNGQSKCVDGSVAGSGYCVYVPEGSQRYTVYPMSEPYIMNLDALPRTCRAWGDPHYITYGAEKFDLQGTGTFTVSLTPSGPVMNTVQTFNCPIKGGSGLNWRITQGIAMAFKFGSRVVSLFNGVVRVNGKAMSKRTHWFTGGLTLIVAQDLLTIQAFSNEPNDDGFVQVSVKTRYVDKSVFGYVYDVAVQVPWSELEKTTGLCRERGDSFTPRGEILFDAVLLKQLEDTCCPPEGCAPPDPLLPPVRWQDVCRDCPNPVPEANAQAACASLQELYRDDCLLDYCASCGDPDAVPPPFNETPDEPLPPGPPFAIEDPHCRNLKGESFDLHATGMLSFLQVPQQGDRPELLVQALIEPVSSKACAPTVIKQVVFSGKWLSGAVRDVPLVISPSNGSVPDLPEEWARFMAQGTRSLELDLKTVASHAGGNLVLTVQGAVFSVNQRVGQHTGVAYLDLKVLHLDRLGSSVGGLLGLDDHKAEAQPAPGCAGTETVRLYARDGQAADEEEGPGDEPRGLLSTAMVM